MRPTAGSEPPASVAQVLAGPHAGQRMAHLAGKLIENGYPIIPVRWGRKSPLISEWTLGWEILPTIEQVYGWLAHWPDCGVGIPCGRVIGADLDILDVLLAGQAQALAFKVLGPTPCIRIGLEPKRLLVYRSEPPLLASIKEHPIEILGKGAQFVAYNLHEVTGRPYDWPDQDLVEMPFDQLPAVTEAQCRDFLDRAWKLLPSRLRQAKRASSRVVQQIQDHGKRRGTLRAIGEALNHIDNSGDGVDYDTWIRFMLAVSHSTGIDGLSLIERWSRQSNKYNTKQNTEKTYLGLNPDGRVTAGTIYRMAMDRDWAPEPDVILDADVEAALAAVTLDEGLFIRAKPNGDGAHVPDPELEPELIQLLPVIPELAVDLDLIRHPGGFLEQIANWITATGKRPQPELAMGAGIALLGFMGAHRYRVLHDGHDTRTNVIVVGLAPSAAGKEHPRQCLKAVLTNMDNPTGMAAFLKEDIASGQGLEAAFVKHFANLVLIDEFGHRISAAMGANSSSYDKKLVEVITKLSTSASGVYIHTLRAGHRHAGDDVPVTYSPCLAMFNTTVEMPLWEGLTSGNISDGSLARMIFVRAAEGHPPRLKGQRHYLEMLPEIVEHCQQVFCGYANQGAVNARIGHLQARYEDKVRKNPDPPSPIDLRFTSEAMVELERIADDEDALLANKGLGHVNAIVGRLVENTKTLAMICASSLDPLRTEIDKRPVLWGEAVAKNSIAIVTKAVEQHIAETRYHALLNKVWRKVEGVSHGGWIDLQYVTERIHGLGPKRDRDEMLQSLVSVGRMGYRKIVRNGKEVHQFRSVG